MTAAPAICLSDDLDELHAAAETARARRAAAEAAIELADTGSEADYPAYERACATFDRHDDELALIERRIDELEEEEGWEVRREERRAYWASVL